MAKEYVAPEMEIVEVDANDGNKYSLPYGIAKGMGLDTAGMRPREVWEMLKGYGITPENEYEKLKEKAAKETPKQQVEQVSQRETKIKSIMMSPAFSKLPEEVREKIGKALEKLSDEQFAVFEKYAESVGGFKNGQGSYSRWGKTIEFSQDSKGGKLDKELGYDFDAATFFHEYGHYVDNMLSVELGGPTFGMSSAGVSVKEDALFAFNEIMKESGISVAPLASFDRISREQKHAFYRGLAKITGKDQLMAVKTLGDFGYVKKPYKPSYTPEQAVRLFGVLGSENNKKLWQQYEEGMKKFELAEADGTNERARQELNAYNEQMAKHNAPIEANLERYGIISDFFGLYTKDRISPLKNGYWGHKGTYNKTMSTQGETWAEYFSFKMTNDKKGLEAMKKYFPKTFNEFESRFNSIKK